MKHIAMSLTAVAMVALQGCSAASEPDPATGKTDDVAMVAPVEADDTSSPSFDCSKAGSEAETLVCTDPVLGRLDTELARLYTLAEADKYLGATGASELKATQRGWVKGRDDCWKADDKRGCVVSAYAMRILELRQNYVNARTADADSLSSGPVAFQCEGLDFGIGAVFINSDPDVTYLKWFEHEVALMQVEAASGARFEGNGFDGAYTLWSKGDDALFTRPGEAAVKCKQEEIG